MKNAIFYLCNDPERALGLEDVIANYHIICIDNHPMIPILRKNGVAVFSLSEEIGEVNPIFRSTQKLLESKVVQDYINNISKSPNIIVFKPSPRLERLASELGYKLMNPPSKMNRLFENKVSQYNLLNHLEIGFPATVTGYLKDYQYEDLLSSLGAELVVQFNRGHTGNSTFFVTNEKEYTELSSTFPMRLCRISKFIEGEAWTVNCCATRSGTAVHGLSYQITGISQLTDLVGSTVGNDWSRSDELSDRIKRRIIEIGQKSGDFMYSKGFIGMFGLDLIVTPDEEVYLIEINARQPASTSMHAKLMLARGLPPLQLLHINEFIDTTTLEYKSVPLNNPISVETIDTINEDCMNKVNASQVIMRNITDESRTDNKINASIGIYKDSRFVREDYSVSGLDEQDQILMLRLCLGQSISKNGEVARIQSKSSLSKRDDLIQQFIKIVKND